MTFNLFNEPAAPLPNWRGALLLFAALSSGLLFSCSSDEPKAAVPASVSAATDVVQVTAINTTRDVAGTVVSSNVSALSSKVTGSVVRVYVAEGDRVRAGQLLVEIDSREGKAQADRARAGSIEVERAIDGARASAALADATLRRYSSLFERRSVSAQELDDTRARQAAAQAELARLVAMRDGARASGDMARSFLAESFLRSPIDGVVTRRFVDPGAFAMPGMPLIAVEDARSYRVEASVASDQRVAPGGRVSVEIAGARIDGRVSQVQPDVDAQSRSSLVKIVLDTHPASLRSGAYARVLLPAGERSGLTVPSAAIVRRGQITSVFVVGTDRIARMRLITLGSGDEVLSGLAAGETIVTEPSKVVEGAKIV